jgi:thioredoxin 1
VEDKELEEIKQKKLQDMMNKHKESQELEQISIVDINQANFNDIITKNSLVLIDFWAEWCGPCRLMHPVFDRMSKKYKQIKFARLNVDQNQNLAMQFNVQSIPTFIMFKDGKEAQRMMGAVGEPGIHMIAKKFTGC